MAAVTVGALAMTGTALAASGGGAVADILGGPDEHQQEFAQDLAGRLGVSESKVEQALQGIEDQHRTEATREMAEGIAAQLDGVSADDVAKILEAEQAEMEAQMRSGQVPDPGTRSKTDPLVSALADGLDLSQGEVESALTAAGKAHEEAERKEMEKRLDAAVASGELSQSQADRIRRRIEAGPPAGGPGGPGGPGVGGPGAMGGFPGGPGMGGPPPGGGFPGGPDGSGSH
ncbi:MAG: hypothetical protein U0R52_11555 [Solirubrobacterales bacterium]